MVYFENCNSISSGGEGGTAQSATSRTTTTSTTTAAAAAAATATATAFASFDRSNLHVDLRTTRRNGLPFPIWTPFSAHFPPLWGGNSSWPNTNRFLLSMRSRKWGKGPIFEWSGGTWQTAVQSASTAAAAATIIALTSSYINAFEHRNDRRCRCSDGVGLDSDVVFARSGFFSSSRGFITSSINRTSSQMIITLVQKISHSLTVGSFFPQFDAACLLQGANHFYPRNPFSQRLSPLSSFTMARALPCCK